MEKTEITGLHINTIIDNLDPYLPKSTNGILPYIVEKCAKSSDKPPEMFKYIVKEDWYHGKGRKRMLCLFLRKKTKKTYYVTSQYHKDTRFVNCRKR